MFKSFGLLPSDVIQHSLPLRLVPPTTIGYNLNYTKFYIGLSKDGISKNFISFKPKKLFLKFYIKCPQIKNEFRNNRTNRTRF